MKKCLLVGAVLSLVAFSAASYAEAAHPCKTIESLCKAQGFYKGGSNKGKGLYKDCVQPLADGKSVANIKVAPADVAGCHEMIKKMDRHWGA